MDDFLFTGDFILLLERQRCFFKESLSFVYRYLILYYL